MFAKGYITTMKDLDSLDQAEIDSAWSRLRPLTCINDDRRAREKILDAAKALSQDARVRNEDKEIFSNIVKKIMLGLI